MALDGSAEFPYYSQFMKRGRKVAVGGLLIGLAVGTVLAVARARLASERAAFKNARSIALQGLEDNIARFVDPADPAGGEKQFILAGGVQYHTVWIRDASMAIPGALVAGRQQAVHDTLEAVFKLQRANGLIPRLVDSTDANIRWALGLARIRLSYKPPLIGWFETEHHVIAIDMNAAFPWAASHYVMKTQDREFALKWFSGAESAVEYLQRHNEVEGLIGNQSPYSDWADSVERTGRVAFTNELYILALRGLADWAAFLDKKDESKYYASAARRANERFIKHFWDDKRGIITNFDGDEHITADANLMAIVYDLVPEEKAKRILKALKETPLWSPIPGRATWPNYGDHQKSMNVKFVDIAGYHDSFFWFWLSALAARAELRYGNCVGYRNIMRELSEQIVRDGAIYEVYEEKAGKVVPVERVLYHSERPFTWSTGMFLDALDLESRCPQ